MTTQTPLTTACPHCGRVLLTFTGLLVSLDSEDPRRNALEGLEQLCDCEESKHTAEQEKRAQELARQQKQEEQKTAALQARFENAGFPEAWKSRALSCWQVNSPERQQAKDAAIAFGAELVTQSKSPASLFIAGDIGTGKTYLASCLAADLIRRKVQVRWCNVGDVLRTIRSSFDQKNLTEEETIRRFTSPRVLVLDDLGKERPTEWAVEQLFSIINTRYDAGLPLIVTTNYGGADLVKRLTPRGDTDDTTPRAIVDRLRAMSKVVKLEGESWR